MVSVFITVGNMALPVTKRLIHLSSFSLVLDLCYTFYIWRLCSSSGISQGRVQEHAFLYSLEAKEKSCDLNFSNQTYAYEVLT